ncbi:HAMP domain-containing histidine kinase [Mesorhizobium sp. M0134]|uniref:sensor histidine kinase n=1 Tax=Mesorhizobium sp. M0134 TaxID=2956889 RepID=UPI00333DB44B
MTFKTSSVFANLPYVGLCVALVLSTWAFLQSEQYRHDTDEILSQTYEIQWRATQVRERLLRVNGYVRLASEAGKLEPDISRQIALVSVNIQQLLALSYVDRFLPKKDAKLLQDVRQIIEQKVTPIIVGGSNYAQALPYMDRLEQDMFEVSSATVNHSATLQETAQIDIAASRNWFLFAIALGLVAIFYLIIHQRYAFISRRDQHLRSFASLFAHMTRSRVTALRLFLDNTGLGQPPSEEMLKAARSAANELESINNGLLKIAYSERDPRSEELGRILRNVAERRNGLVKLDIDIDTVRLPVPATQFQLLIDELVQNAETAVNGRQNPKITVRTALRRLRFLGRTNVILEVSDNGVGMTPEIAEKATVPFFSTKAGNHVGLGLTGCAQMAATLRGKLTVNSSPDNGTVVQVRIPIQTLPATANG